MSITLRGLRDLTSRAISYGASRIEGSNSFEWDVRSYCEKPFNRTLHARGYPVAMQKYKSSVNPGTLTLHMQGLPCRKCAKCRYIKSAFWADRIIRENAMTDRNWFVTLTLSPEEHHRVFMEEIAYRNSRGWRDDDFDKPDAEWRLRCDGVSKLLTKYLKRVRKPLAGEDHIGLRYVAVTEPHKNGLPHLHLIMHERAGKLTYRRICDRWDRHGLSDASLVRDPVKSGHYVAKYLTKQLTSRIRASQHYGELPDSEGIAELAQRIADLIDPADQSE